jgi:ribonuclease BN (tRNA processing enzyme)
MGPEPNEPNEPNELTHLSLTVLGCSGSYPGPAQACSGYLVRAGGTTVWLDAGPGTLANLQTHIGLADVDAVVLSHQHPDHWTDIEGFFVACRYIVERNGIPVYAPRGLEGLLRTGPTTAPTLEWHVVADGTALTIGPMTLTFSQTDHPYETLAVRVDGGGRSLGYSADSGPAWSLEALGPGLHLAVCEATFLRDREGTFQHLSARQAGATARAAGVERLLLTHLWPTVDREEAVAEATASFGDAVALAAMDDTYLV